MVYFAIKNGQVIYHTDKQAMWDMDGLKPQKEITNAEFIANNNLARVIKGKIFIGYTDEEKADMAEQAALTAEETQLQTELDSKDYKVTKAAETGLVLAVIDPALHERREFCRGRINQIRERLTELEGEDV